MNNINLWITKIFNLKQHGSNVSTEILAGITTFLTMSYIIFVNPAILASTGMDLGAVFTATCITTIIGTLLIAIFANYPIAIAPGMGLNIYFSYVVVAKLGFNWQNALGMVFISGVLFLLFTLTKIRKYIIIALPKNLHFAITIGIGLLIALIALKNSQIIIADRNTLLTLANLNSIPSLLFIIGFLIIVSLDYLQVKGAILIGILTVTVFNLFIGSSHFHGLVALPPSIAPVFMQLKFDQLVTNHAFTAIFTFFLIALFDATGTFIGLLNLPDFNKEHNYLRRVSNSLLADSLANVCGAVLGTSSTSPFIESEAGIQTGGRTGLVAWVVCGLFILALFFYPLAQIIPNYAVSPALLFIACSMMKCVTEISFKDVSEAIPATLTIIMIPFTFSIADGIGWGIVSYTLLKVLTGQFKKINLMLIMLTILFIFLFAIR